MHDFSAGVLPDGLFWIVRVPDTAVTSSGRTVTVRLSNVPEVDGYTFYNPLPPSGNVASVTSFVMTYTKVGAPRQIRPRSTASKSPFNWAGQMWKATGSVRFSAAYIAGTFSVQGSASSTGQFGEMGTERNGYFLTHQ